MKSKQLFWGVLFLTLGVIYLLVEVMHVHLSIAGFYNYWPLSLILIGLSVLSSNNYAKLTFSGLSGLVFALVLFSFFSKSWLPWDDWDDKAHTFSTVEQFSEPFDNKVKTVNATFKMGAGRIEIRGDDSNLVTVKSGGMKELFSVDVDKQEDNYDFDISMENVHLNLNKNDHRRLEVGFNNKPNYTFDFELGAADVDMDLSSLKVEKINLETGAASCTMKVKEFASDTMNIRVEAGAASVRIILPKDAGAQIKRETSLASTNFEGFKEISEDLFQTENFSSVKKKIFIEIEGGVASFHVSRN
ncbi:MAG: hypothetical protein M0P61_15835 [Ignavibacteriaceae bacterium]|jgi:hypothetical protein|nr:hypothetical protein [Ignavibacteriaceae bacterium]